MPRKISPLVFFLSFLAICVLPWTISQAGTRETVYYIEQDGVFVPDHCGGPPRDCYVVHPPE